MYILENKELYRYEVHSLVKAFYPAEDVRVVIEGTAKAEKEREDHPVPFMYVCFSENGIQIRYEDGRTYDTFGTEEADKAGGDVCYDRKSPACKEALKHLVYRSLCEVTEKSLPWGDLIGIRPTKIAMAQIEKGASPEEAAAFMEAEHFCSSEKAALAARIAVREKSILDGMHRKDGYSLYIGIPFCPTTCLYCSFTSYSEALWRNRIDEYVDTLIREMKECAPLTEGLHLDCVYIGGGTPTTLSPQQLDRLLSAAEEYFPVQQAAEFTVEAGRPDSITSDKLRVMKKHPVTRISVNPQTMRDRTLQLIGRRHSAEETADAFRLARQEGFDNINMDIILGLPGETAEDVRYTLEEIRKLSPESLTVHSLAVKRASRLAGWIEANGFSMISNTDECMDIAAAGAAEMGMEPYYLYRQKNMAGNYENTGYAVPGSYGLYNMAIIEECQSILALGAGAISKRLFFMDDGSIRIERSDNAKDVETYLKNIDEMIERKRKLFMPQESD